MDKKELIFPGIILGIVLIAAVGLILTQGGEKPPLSTSENTASSTQATSTASASGASKDASQAGSGGSHAATAPKYYYPYGRVTLALNQAAGFKNGASIRPLQVLEDSRCPVGVMCIQAGTVKITMRAKGGGSENVLTMSVGERNTFDGLSIFFESVEPVKHQGGTPAASAYRFTLVVEPAGTGSVSTAPCYVGGCSSEICSATKGQVSSCIYRAEYACYRDARCERQANGACGWTQTAELSRCLVTAQGT